MTAQGASVAGNYVNGSWRKGASSTVMEITNPATFETSIALAEAEDTDAAVQAPPQERITGWRIMISSMPGAMSSRL